MANKLRKRKYGGPGTKVGNLLRRAVNRIEDTGAYNRASNIVNKIKPFSSVVGFAPGVNYLASVASFANDVSPRNTVNPSTPQFPVSETGLRNYRFNQNLNQENLPDAGLFGNPASVNRLNALNSGGEAIINNSNGGGNQGQSTIEDQPLVANQEPGPVDEFGRSADAGVTLPQYNSGPEESSFGADNRSATPSQRSFSVGLGSSVNSPNVAGGLRGLGILGTNINDPVYENLLKQSLKDSQSDVNYEDIKAQNEARAQAEIDAVNAIYADIIKRAEKTGKENLGSERALQARSGNLGNDFGNSALANVKSDTNQEIGRIGSEQSKTIADILNTSRSNALSEYQTLRGIKAQDFESLMNIKDRQQEVFDAGLNDMASYIALSGVSVEDLGAEGLKELAKDWKTTPQRVFNAIKTKEAELYQTELDQQEQMGAFKTSSSVSSAPDNFDTFSQEAIAFSVLPTQLKNSDKEKEYYLGGIRQGLEQGYDPYEIADALLGYKVENKTNLSNNLRSLIGQSELDPAKIAQVARNLNAGKNVQAMELVENSIMGRARKDNPDAFIGESTVKTAVDRSTELADFLDGLDKSPIGVTSGTMEKWLRKLRGKNSSKILTQTTRMVAEMRNKLSGTAVTESEKRFLDELVPDLNDKPDVFMYKLESLANQPLLELNNLRQVYGLIPLDMNTLLNKDSRVQAYNGIQSQQYSAPTNIQQNFGGGGSFSW